MYAVQFDIEYLDGALAGLPIPGQIVTYAERSSAERALTFYRKVEQEADFIRAAGTGHRYKVANVLFLTDYVPQRQGPATS